MIFCLKGVVQEFSPTYVVIEVGGVGYYLGISLQTSQRLVLGKEFTLYTQSVIREDAHLLFGFFEKREKEMFNLLLGVNGVGAVSAMILLSSLELAEISRAIISRNSGVLQKVKGIGAKTAERIIVDLRDKVRKFEGDIDEKSSFVDNRVREEALSALEVLGIPRKTSERISEKILEKSPEISTEVLVKQVLKKHIDF